MFRINQMSVYAVLVLLGTLLSACGGAATSAPATAPVAATSAAMAEPTTEAAVALFGDIAVDGSSTVFPITEAAAEEFGAVQPAVRVTVGVSGTGGGFKKFCNSETDIQDASRAIKQSEIDLCAAAGVEYVELLVGLDGLTVVVNPQNDFATCLTVEQLNKMWDTGSTVANWNEVDASFPATALVLYGPGTDSGTFDFFTEVINGEAKRSRADFTASEDDNVLVQGVSGDKNALGYFGLAYFLENQDKLKALEIDGGEGCVAPSFETVNSGEYAPLSRPLYIYVSKAALERPEVLEFVKFYLISAPELVAEVGYVSVDQAVYDEGLAAIEEATK